jgi:putative membrane protein
MKTTAKSFFSRDEREKIRQAVETAEKKTMGEIAVMLVDESDRYREAELLGAFFLSGLVAFALSLVLRYLTVWFYIPVAVVLFVPFFFVFRRIPALKLPFLGEARVDQAVRQRAVLGFYEKGVHRTEERTGILIFISLLEREVWFLGDEGINSKIQPETWTSLAEELARGIKEGRAVDALRTSIEKCGAELARHFPGRAGQKNELCDDVIC